MEPLQRGRKSPLSSSALRLLVVAGEASADLYASAVVRELSGHGAIEVRGMGGKELKRAGMELTVDLRDVTTMGGLEVASRLPRLAQAFVRLIRQAHSFRPHLALLVDLPDFNMPLARALRAFSIPCCAYVAPQFWAWRSGRAQKMRRFAHVACIFPFEEPLLRSAGVSATYVGHPLLDAPPLSRRTARLTLGLSKEERCLALLPGSRPSEVSTLLAPMLEGASRIVKSAVQPVRIVVAGASSLPRPDIPSDRVLLWTEGPSPGRLVLAAADAAFVASGTATLEALLAGTPQVVAYRLSAPTMLLARMLVRTRFFAMPNILAHRQVVPELLQGQVCGDTFHALGQKLLFDRHTRVAQKQGYEQVRRSLGEGGASRATARLLLSLVEASAA